MKRQVGKLEGEKREGDRGWCVTNQRIGKHPLGLCISLPLSPPRLHPLYGGLGEHADCWLSVVQCERPGEQARGEWRSVTVGEAKQAGEQVIREHSFRLQSRKEARKT